MVAQSAVLRIAPVLLLAVWLAGCGTGPTDEPAPAPVVSTPVGQSARQSAPDAPAAVPATSVPQTSRPSPPPPAPPRPNAGGGDTDGGRDIGGINAGTPLRIPLPQDRLTSLKLPAAEARLKFLIGSVCDGGQCLAVEVRATQEDPPVPGQSCDDVEGLVGMAEDASGDPYVDAVAGGHLTLLTNIRCEHVPAEGSSDNGVPPANKPGPEGGGVGSEDDPGATGQPDVGEDPGPPGGNLGNPTVPTGGSTGTAETEPSGPEATPGGTP